MMQLKDFTILLQNLLNRATDIEIGNAAIEKRVVKFENIEANLATLKKLAGGEIAAHAAKVPPEAPKPAFDKKAYYSKFKKD
jgi:hypothetical protein